MADVWSEKFSNELKKLKTVVRPTASQAKRIKALLALKAAKETGTVVKEDPSLTGVVDSKTGAIDAPKAAIDIGKSESGDIDTNFKLGNPETITDAFGNKRTVLRDPKTGVVTELTEVGGIAKTFQDKARAAVEGYKPVDLSGAPIVSGGTKEDRMRAEEAAYGVLTRDYNRDEGRELEAAKQELANRGIPYDPAAAQDRNSSNLYGRTVGGITQKFQGERDQARLRAAGAGNEFMLANTQASGAANQAFVNAALGQNSANLAGINTLTGGATSTSGNFQPYQATSTDSSANDLAIIGMSSDSIAKERGISVAEADAIRTAAIQREALKKSGGSGGSGGRSSGGKDNSSTPIISGGPAPGFDI